MPGKSGDEGGDGKVALGDWGSMEGEWHSGQTNPNGIRDVPDKHTIQSANQKTEVTNLPFHMTSAGPGTLHFPPCVRQPLSLGMRGRAVFRFEGGEPP
jgi:hypothetical protein